MKEVILHLRKVTGYRLGTLLCGVMAYGWVVLARDGQ